MRTSRLLLCVLLAAVALFVAWPRGSAHPDDDNAPPALAAPHAGEPESVPSLPVPPSTLEPEALASGAPQAEVKAHAASEAPALAVDDPTSLADLIEELLTEHEERPDGFRDRAPELLLEFVGERGPELPHDEAAIREVLETQVLPSPVRGALVVLWGAIAPAAPLIDWVGADLEERRGMWLGLTAAWPGAPSTGVALELSEFFEVFSRPETTPAFRLQLARPAEAELEQVLLAELLRTAVDWDEILDRHLATLAIGVGIDQRDYVFETFVSLLFDDTLLGRQVRVPLLFVLTRSPRARSQAIVARYLRETPDGDLGKDLARMWASERGGSGLTVTEMLDPLVNVTDPMAALFAASALGKWITATEEAGGTVSAQELQYAQDVLAEALSTQTDEQLRIGAVGTLAYSMRDGYTRLDSLRQVLEGGDDPLLRRMAVDGLAGTAGELEAEARAVLQSWVSQETDPKLKQHIEAKLAAASATGEG